MTIKLNNFKEAKSIIEDCFDKKLNYRFSDCNSNMILEDVENFFLGQFEYGEYLFLTIGEMYIEISDDDFVLITKTKSYQ